MPKTFVFNREGVKLGELPSVAKEPELTPNVTILNVGGYAIDFVVEQAVAHDLPRGVERLDGLRRLRAHGERRPAGARERGRENRAADHLISALISAGGSNVPGGTLSYSTVEMVTVCSIAIVRCLIVVGISSLPNLR